MWKLLIALIGYVYAQTDVNGYHRIWFDSMSNFNTNWTKTSDKCIQKTNSPYCESNTNQVRACVEMRGSRSTSSRCSITTKHSISLVGYHDVFLTFLAVEYAGTGGFEANDRFYVKVNCYDTMGWRILLTLVTPFNNVGSGTYTENNYAKVHLPSSCTNYVSIQFANNAGSTGDKVAVDSVGLWAKRNLTTPSPTYYQTPHPTYYHYTTSSWTPSPTYYQTPHPTYHYSTSRWTPSPTSTHWTAPPSHCYCPPSPSPTYHYTSTPWTPSPTYNHHTTTSWTPSPIIGWTTTQSSSGGYIYCGRTYYGHLPAPYFSITYQMWVPHYGQYQSVRLSTCNSYTNFDTLIQANFSNGTSSECDDCGFCGGNKADWLMIVNSGTYMTVTMKGYGSTYGQYQLSVSCSSVNNTPSPTYYQHTTSNYACAGPGQYCGMYTSCCDMYSSCHNYLNEILPSGYYGRCRSHINTTMPTCKPPQASCNMSQCCYGHCSWTPSAAPNYGYCISYQAKDTDKTKWENKLNSLTDDDVHPQLKKWLVHMLSDDDKARLRALKDISLMIDTFEEQKTMLARLKSQKQFSAQAIADDLPIDLKGNNIPLVFGYQLNIVEFFALGALVGVLLALISLGAYTKVRQVIKLRGHNGYEPLQDIEGFDDK